jgi:hypothetical protein
MQEFLKIWKSAACPSSLDEDEPWSEQWHAASTLATWTGCGRLGTLSLAASEYSPRQIASRSTQAQIKPVVDGADYALALIYCC